jgi:F-box protein 9
MEESNPELESFRQKWREEVSARTKAEGNRPPPSSSSDSSKSSRRPPPAPRIANLKGLKTLVEEEYAEPPNFGGFDGPSGYGDVEAEESSKTGGQEPRSALEHYEKAVERENLGSLGDSLDLYRKAFKVGCNHSLGSPV